MSKKSAKKAVKEPAKVEQHWCELRSENIFNVGDTFNCYEDLVDRLKRHEQLDFVNYWRRDTRTVKGAQNKTSRPIEERLKYYSVRYACVYGGQNFTTRSQGRRNSNTIRLNCPSFILVRASKCGELLEVISVCNQHNHEISEATSKSMIQNRRLSNDMKMEVLQMLHYRVDRKKIIEYVRMKTNKIVTLKDLLNIKTLSKNQPILINNFKSDEQTREDLTNTIEDLIANSTDSTEFTAPKSKTSYKLTDPSTQKAFLVTLPEFEIADGDLHFDNVASESLIEYDGVTAYENHYEDYEQVEELEHDPDNVEYEENVNEEGQSYEESTNTLENIKSDELQCQNNDIEEYNKSIEMAYGLTLEEIEESTEEIIHTNCIENIDDTACETEDVSSSQNDHLFNSSNNSHVLSSPTNLSPLCVKYQRKRSTFRKSINRRDQKIRAFKSKSSECKHNIRLTQLKIDILEAQKRKLYEETEILRLQKEQLMRSIV